MKYINYLKNKNLSKNTIRIYLNNLELWKKYLKTNKENKSIFTKFIKDYSKTRSANSTRLMYYSILSYFKYEKKWKLFNECKDIKLPSIVSFGKTIINLDELESTFNSLKNNLSKWSDKRNWLIFLTLFYTGIRISEISKINFKKIENNTLLINGKGNKTRTILIPYKLIELSRQWNIWKLDKTINNQTISINRISKIICIMGMNYFNKKISAHSLRRSYATNLSKNNVDINIISKLLGHSNINTTSRYINYSLNDIQQEISRCFN